MQLVAVVRSESETHALASALAPCLGPGSVLCLDGALGAGKTAFVAGLAAALGARAEVTSPTFTLENRYPIEGDAAISEILHCDLYRPGDDARRDLLPSMLEARDDGALIAVEWGAPVKDWLTPYLQIDLEFVAGTGEHPPRRITLEPVPAGWPSMERLRVAWEGLVSSLEVRA